MIFQIEAKVPSGGGPERDGRVTCGLMIVNQAIAPQSTDSRKIKPKQRAQHTKDVSHCFPVLSAQIPAHPRLISWAISALRVTFELHRIEVDFPQVAGGI